ncbi:DUF4815 domain-containing protein [Secundilactobacillus kimchicus]|uniref:DUF4815 domain-containing protein n=1 Tax=Secundilactobacillus kimchicus TaxID=528209 RepID=UPI001C02DE37|nr:DUF4815 domain-containing protein [Secundilactobacillus kimchicus]MBT9670557.1 DUF4815 domain-containing protein [Secundilactobacillus kimchicus]
MATFDDSKPDFNDRFKESNRWIKLLFHPTRPLFQSELNEMQSNLLSQVSLLGNTSFKEGAIISGMSLVPKGKDENVVTNPDGQPSIISLANITSQNSKVDNLEYPDSGMLKIYTAANLASDFPGIRITTDSVTGEFTLSFSIQRTSGMLHKLSGKFNSELMVSNYTIDGKKVYNAFDQADNSPLQDINGNQINLSDGNEHSFVVTFSGANGNHYNVTLLANTGYDALVEGRVDFTFNHFKAEAGSKVTEWAASINDAVISTGKYRNQNLTVTSGQVYIGGLVRLFTEQNIKITGVGKETIGLLLNERVVTSGTVPELLDHSRNTASQYKKGADRLTYDINLAYNDSNAVTLYQLQDGKIVNDPVKPQESVLNDILAKRTDDESGSYAVNGFKMWSNKDDQDSSVVDVYVDSGTAYVKGYQIIKSTSTKLKVPKAEGTKTVKDEVFIYSPALPLNGQLGNQPVQTVSQVSGNVRVIEEAVTRSTPTSNPDKLDRQAYSIDSIYAIQGNNKVTFEQGVDFKLQNGNEIVWGITNNSKEPAQGTTYYVTYQYERIFVKDTDYKVVTAGEQESQVTSIVFDGVGGAVPAENSQVHVSYTYFLARIDTVTLDKDGQFTIIKGQQDKLSQAKPVPYIDPNTLIMGYITVFPNSDKAITQAQTTLRIPFYGLQNMASRINDLEYNMAVQELRYNTMINQDPVTLKNTFSDDFMSLEKSDTGNKQFTARVNVNGGTATIQDKASMEMKLEEDTVNSNVHHFQDLITPQFIDKPIISQTKVTGVTNINPYDNFQNLGDLILDPASDSWIDEKHTTVENEKQGADTGSGSSVTRVEDGVTTSTTSSDTAVEYIRTRTINFVGSNLMPMEDNFVITFDGKPVDIIPAEGFEKGTQAGSAKSDGNGQVKGSFVIPSGVRTGTRQVDLKNEKNLASAYYIANGIIRTYTTTNTKNWHNNRTQPVYYSPTYYSGPTVTGQYSNVVFDHSMGAGLVNEVTTVYSDGSTSTSYNHDGQSYDSGWGYGNSNYPSAWVDPLSQSFSPEEDMTITSLNLYFASMPKESSIKRAQISVEIRQMSNGYPAKTIITKGVINPEDVKVSGDGSVATKVDLREPLLAAKDQSYAITLITSSDAYSMYTATIGQVDINTKEKITSPAYTRGTFFISRNAETWTPEIDTSLKFELNKATFATAATETFKPIEIAGKFFQDYQGKDILDGQNQKIALEVNRAVLLAQYLTPNKTSLNFEIRYVLASQPENVSVNDSVWEPFQPNTDVNFRELLRELQLRINLKGTSDFAPEINTDSMNFIVYRAAEAGTYLSRDLNMFGTPFNHLRTQYEAYTPNGTTIVPQYSTDSGKTWHDYSQAYVRETQVDNMYTKYEYDLQLYEQSQGDQTKANNFKIRLGLASSDSYGVPVVRRLMNSMSLQDGSETAGDGYQKVVDTTYIQPGTLLWNSLEPLHGEQDLELYYPVTSIKTSLMFHGIDYEGHSVNTEVSGDDVIAGLNSDDGITVSLGDETFVVTRKGDSTLKMAGLTHVGLFAISTGPQIIDGNKTVESGETTTTTTTTSTTTIKPTTTTTSTTTTSTTTRAPVKVVSMTIGKPLFKDVDTADIAPATVKLSRALTLKDSLVMTFGAKPYQVNEDASEVTKEVDASLDNTIGSVTATYAELTSKDGKLIYSYPQTDEMTNGATYGYTTYAKLTDSQTLVFNSIGKVNNDGLQGTVYLKGWDSYYVYPLNTVDIVPAT